MKHGLKQRVGGTDDETQHTERTKGQHGIGTGRMDGLTRIGNPAQDAFTAHDEAYRSRMSHASAALLRAIERTRTGRSQITPRDFLWHEHTYVGGSLAEPESANSRLAPLRVAALLDEKERVRSLVVKRDPCPRCGTRMDIGCEHVRVA